MNVARNIVGIAFGTAHYGMHAAVSGAAGGGMPMAIYMIGATVASAVGMIASIAQSNIESIALCYGGITAGIIFCGILVECALGHISSLLVIHGQGRPCTTIDWVIIWTAIILPAISTPILVGIFFPGLSVSYLEFGISVLLGCLIPCLVVTVFLLPLFPLPSYW